MVYASYLDWCKTVANIEENGANAYTNAYIDTKAQPIVARISMHVHTWSFG